MRCRWSYDSRLIIIQRDQVISCSQELLWGDHASLLKSADDCQKPDNMQGILRLFCEDMTNSNIIQMKSRNVFLGPGILTPSGLESRILQPKTKFPYQGVVVGVVVVVQNPGFYYSKFVFSLKWRLYHMYLQSPRLDTIVNVLHLSPSSSENTKTVFLLLHLVSVSVSFVKFMSTTQLFFFPPQF